MKILFTGGGTGGHIFPIIALAREIRRLYPSLDGAVLPDSGRIFDENDKKYKKKELNLFYIGPGDNFAKLFLSQEGIKIKQILAGKIRRYLGVKSIFQTILDIFIKTPIGFIQSFLYIFFLSPDFIFSKGGFGSVPPVLAGWILQVPIFLHESDISPGLANRFLSRFSVEIFISFQKTEYFSPKKMILVGNPIRTELLEGSKEEAKEFFKLTGEKPVILILGGSQGAQRINNMVLEILPEILVNFEIIHQVGDNNFEKIRTETNAMLGELLKPYYHPLPFFKEDHLKLAYRVCDLVASRAGSGSIFEIAATGKPSIFIPLPEAAQNHQAGNAYAYSAGGACIVIEEANLTPRFFLEKLKYLFAHPSELDKMQKAAIEFSKPMAARIIANYIVSYLTTK